MPAVVQGGEELDVARSREQTVEVVSTLFGRGVQAVYACSHSFLSQFLFGNRSLGEREAREEGEGG